MTSPLFLASFTNPQIGDNIRLTGEEAAHAQVKRIQVGEQVLLANGAGLGVAGIVTQISREEVMVAIQRVITEPLRRQITVIQALPKGDRALLAVQMLTELGAQRIAAWQSQRSIVRWSRQRAEKSLAKWKATARESAKQARRFSVPALVAVTNKDLPELLKESDTVLVLHEEADRHLREVSVSGKVAIVVGPEGGISPEELDLLVACGGIPVRISDHVLRTSTAGAVALGQLELK